MVRVLSEEEAEEEDQKEAFANLDCQTLRFDYQDLQCLS